MRTLSPWKLKDISGLGQISKKIARTTGLSEFFCCLLAQRGITTAEDAELFLEPSLKHLQPLSSWPALEEASNIICNAYEKREKIIIWGDYDVDGVTSSALLIDFFRKRLGVHVKHFLPHRVKHGYGMNMNEIENLAKDNVKTLITVDCGIANIKEIQRAKELGMRVVLTDHHLPGEILPSADIVLNPKVNGECPSRKLAGVGVAFYLAAQLNCDLPGEKIDIRQFLDLVALGTIADIVDIDLTNRILVKNGLSLLSVTKRPGIVALKKVGGIENKDELKSFDVGFVLGPRLNASGRLKSPDIALDLLLEEDPVKAQVLAIQLDELNTKRKEFEKEITDIALETLRSTQENRLGLVAYGENWHPGVIGIVASRIVEEFKKPAFVLTKQDGKIKGSGRSIPGVHLHDILTSLQQHLIKFGGHSQAAGVTLAPENLELFQDGFNSACKDVGASDIVLKKQLDLEIDPADLTEKFIKELDLLQPTGPTNKKPDFLSSKMTVVEQRLIGKEKDHVKLTLSNDKVGFLTGLIWRQGEQWGEDGLLGRSILTSYYPSINDFNGKRSIQITINDVLAVS